MLFMLSHKEELFCIEDAKSFKRLVHIHEFNTLAPNACLSA